VILLVAAIDRLARASVPGRAWAAAVAIAAVAWLAGEAQTSASDLQIIHRDGAGFSASRYRLSAAVAAIRRRRIAPAYSDEIAGLYFLTGVRSACWPTNAYGLCGNARLDLGPGGNGKDVYLAWFAEPGGERPSVPSALRRRIRLVPVLTSAYSDLYRVVLTHHHA
jgi:hypothetical protein